MTETLLEFCDWRGATMRIDRPAGVIRGVKILGLESRNGRTYLPEALAAAVALYEEAKVNVNHPKSVAANPRDYQDRIGAIRDVTSRPDGLYADFHFNPKHQLAEQLLWDAEHAPENVGFSHNVEARTARRGDRTVVEAITRVQSVDLVADPATTRGLFESGTSYGNAASSGNAASRASMTLESLQRDYPELVEALVGSSIAETRRLQAEVERLAARESDHQKRQAMRELLREFRLPDLDADDAQARSITSQRFIDSLMTAPDQATMRALIEERASLIRALGAESLSPFTRKPVSRDGRPTSRDQYTVDGSARIDTRAFVEAIT